MQDLVAGQIDLMIADPASAMPQFRAGRIKVFAVMAKVRWAGGPDIPTADEAGLPGFYLSPWHGMWAPKGTPNVVIARINTAIVQALADPAIQKRFGELGVDIPAREQQTAEGFGAFHKAEIAKWWPIIKEAGVKPQ